MEWILLRGVDFAGSIRLAEIVARIRHSEGAILLRRHLEEI
jgi:hypothetical protein